MTYKELPPLASHAAEACACSRSFRDCYSDEHYFATLLATHGRDNETDCLGGITYAHWENWGDSHPKAWAPEEVTANLCAPPCARPHAHNPALTIHLPCPLLRTCETQTASAAHAAT